MAMVRPRRWLSCSTEGLAREDTGIGGMCVGGEVENGPIGLVVAAVLVHGDLLGTRNK